MIGPVVMHLAESTVFAGVAALLLLGLRVRKPGVRHAAWVLAALKFALPATLLTGLGGGVRTLAPRPIPIAWYPIARSASAVVLAHVSTMPAAAPVSQTTVEAALLCVWLAGAVFAMCVWLRRWLGSAIRTIPAPASEAATLHRLAARADVRRAVTLRHSTDAAAPSLSGIRRPVVNISATLAGELDLAEFESVMLHELAHVRRWDNLCSAVVHAIACVFWFYPLTWWIERKIALEAERACDQLVVGWGVPGESYASGILKVCRLQIAVPLAGVSGIGSSLSDRIEWILSKRIVQSGGFRGAVTIAMLAAAMTMAPLAVGFLAAPVKAAQTVPPVAAVAPDGPPQSSAAPPVRVVPQRKGRRQAAARPPKPRQVWCAYASIWFPEGTVAHQGRSDRMCVGDASGDPIWVLAETAGRPRVGERLDFNTWPLPWAEPPDPSFCKPKVSATATECACQYGPVSAGAVVRGPQGDRIVCEQGLALGAAQWRPAIPGKDFQ